MSLGQNMLAWIDERFPLTKTWNEHISHYFAPKNFNFWYYFGSLAIVVLMNQILTGIWLTMNYKPDANLAFGSVEYIMRDVDWGWLLRYMHSVGSSFFFLVVYLHMFRALMYGSYRKPRELLWVIGMLIFLALMAEGFMGYLLPWGQMSYWGAQVIISLFGAIPVIGDQLTLWIRGDYVVSDATLNRFFALHVIAIPLVLVILVFVHIIALHKVGSNNPDGIEIKKGPKGNRWDKDKPADGIPFHPYYTVKDIFGVGAFLIIFTAVIFYAPGFFGLLLEPNNFIPANPMKTPTHIAPLWFFTPYYAILRAIPDKLLGVIAMFSSIGVFFLLPWLDRSPVKSIRYKGPIFKIALAIFVISFVVLGYLGAVPPSPTNNIIASVFTFLYFAFFITMPIYSKMDKTLPVPERVS